MGRAEPGRLDAMRRFREYFRADTRMELKLGPIDAVLIGSHAGMASYALHFQGTGRDVGRKRVEEKFDLGRATHFFQRETAHPSRRLFCPVTSARTVDSLGAG